MSESGSERDRRRSSWLRGVRDLAAHEWHIIRGRNPDISPTRITEFSGSLIVMGVLILIVGFLPLVAIRITADEANTFAGALLGSFALAAVCVTAVAWLLSIVIAGCSVLVIYRTTAKSAIATTEHGVRASFGRITDMTATVTLVAFISGLVSLAIGLPGLESAETETSVLEQLISVQVACLLLALLFGFSVEAVRTAAHILGERDRVLAWIGALVITVVAFVLAAVAGPFEPVALTRALLTDWLPAEVDGLPREQVIDDVLPQGRLRWSALIVVPYTVVVWWIAAWRAGALRAIGGAVADARDGKPFARSED